MILSAILFIGISGFITMYLSAFMTNVTPTSDFVNDLERFDDVRSDQTIGLNGGLTGYGDEKWPYNFYSVSHGMASMIVTTLILLGPVLLMLRRWRVPAGAFTLILLGYGLLVNVMTEYRDVVLIVPLILAGVAADLVQSRVAARGERLTLGGIRIAGPVDRRGPVAQLLRGAGARQGHRLDADPVGRRADRGDHDLVRRGVPDRPAGLRAAARRSRLEMLLEEADDVVRALGDVAVALVAAR